jgi:uncharacterized repeat protein (TIGR01451 family)
LGEDGFITKVNPNGTGLVFSTLLGGSEDDEVRGIALDTQSNVYVTGITLSFDFPLQNPLQSFFEGGTSFPQDGFVTKLDATGSFLHYSTYMGGNDFDHLNAIAVDSAGNAYVAGGTASSDFPLLHGLPKTLASGDTDAVIFAMAPDGQTLLFSTLLGGSDFDIAGSLALDNHGDIFVAGTTASTNFPVVAAFQSAFNGSSGPFVGEGFFAGLKTLPGLSLSKRATMVGSTISYVLGVHNVSSDAAQSVVVNDPLPDGVTLAACAATLGGACGLLDNQLDVTFASIPPQATATITLSAQVGASVAPGTVLTNTASVSSNSPDPDLSDNTATATVTTASADLSVAVSIRADTPNPITPGNNIIYTVVVSNLGPTAARFVSVTDTFPGHTIAQGFCQADNGSRCISMGTAANFYFPTLAAGSRVTLTTIATVLDSAVNGEILTNVVTVSSPSADPNPANNSASVGAPVVSLGPLQGSAHLVASNTIVSGELALGFPVRYDISVLNTGPDPAPHMEIIDPLPMGLTYLSCSADSGGACSQTGGRVTVSFPSLGLAAAAHVFIDAALNASVAPGTVISNQIVALAAAADPFFPENVATATGTAVQLASTVGIQINGEGNSFAPGSQVTYELTLFNNGPTRSTNVVVKAPLPPQEQFAACQAPLGGTCSAANGLVTFLLPEFSIQVGSLPAAFTVTLDPSLTPGSTVTNSVSISTDTPPPPGGFIPPTLNASVSITVLPPGLQLGMTAYPVRASSGDPVVYTLQLVNGGPARASGITVTDTLPAALVFQSCSSTGDGICAGSANNISIGLDSLAAGDTATVTLVATVAASVTPGASIVNNARVSAALGDSGTTGKTAYVTITDVLAGTLATIHTVAGNGPNNMSAREAYLRPQSIAVDRQGNVFVADLDVGGGSRVLKVDPFGTINRYAGNGSALASRFDAEVGNGGPALDAPISMNSMAFDSSGNLLLAGFLNVRRIDRQTGIITQVVGPDPVTFKGFSDPACFTQGPDGNIYFADSQGFRVFKVSPGTHEVSTVVGRSYPGGLSGDGGPASEAEVSKVTGLAFDSAGNLYIADTGNSRIRRVDASTGIITTVAGGGFLTADGTPATLFRFGASDGEFANPDPPAKIAFDPAGNLLLFGFHRIWRMDIATGRITKVAGAGVFSFSGDGGPATAAMISVNDAASDASGNIFLATLFPGRVRRIDAATGIIATIAGKGNGFDQNGSPDGTRFFSGEGGPAIDSEIRPSAVAFDPAGNLLIADTLDVLRVDASTQKISAIAGTGYFPYSIDGPGGNPLDDITDGVPALKSAIGDLSDIKVDAAGNIFLAERDYFSYRILRIDASTGIINTYAGRCDSTPSPTSPAAGACLGLLQQIALDHHGNVYFSSFDSATVSKIDAQTGMITSIAGGHPFQLSADGNFIIGRGDGGPATSAALAFPSGIVFDASDNLFICDDFDGRVRRVDAQTGIITTYAGGGLAGGDAFSLAEGDGLPATEVALHGCRSLAFDAHGNLHIQSNIEATNEILKVDASSGVLSRVSGFRVNGLLGQEHTTIPTGEDVPALGSLDAGGAMAFAPNGDLFIATDRRVRAIHCPGAECLDHSDPPDHTAPVTSVTITPPPNAAGWNNTDVAVVFTPTDEPGGSGVLFLNLLCPQFPSFGISYGPFAVGQNFFQEGVFTTNYCAVDNALNFEPQHSVTVRLDKTPPLVACGAPDGAWHASDVSIACTASDSGSGLDLNSPANFTATTSVPSSTETASAFTDSRALCDLAGNCSIARPIGPNKVDKKPPQITITAPAATTYKLNQASPSSYTCADGGSGLATCAGPVPSGSNFDTASTGAKTFTVNSSDNVGNASAQPISYDVAYAACLLYDTTRAAKSGSTIPIKFQLCDALGNDVSSAGTTVTALQVVMLSTNASSIVNDAGNATPDSNFRFDPSLGPTGGYIFNLNTTGLSTGTYVVTFRVSGDPTIHNSELIFQAR